MKVAIVMGSTSDAEIMAAAEEYLNYFGIGFETFTMSAHRTPEKTAQFAKTAADNGFSAIIAGAGMAAHLPGVIASYTTLPVIGVPLGGSALNGVDALYAIVQMPAGIPVATMAIGKAGARNAAIFCAEILAAQSPTIKQKLDDFRRQGCALR
ncbi:5-(carboxyamino)imidazole ribonucleotide mutase [candidate division KSB1 bacterium]|nr:5-(carboxyamino)imidazole ribonucleotide mutase [candidate division KSB1 bacterium]RQW05516.1 MAG: 5-(carboxyamino)imidazole ribonucleotide mutase [candidate division KSB1 bacterium]